MRMAFFISSLGDTDLAKATIEKLKGLDSTDEIFIIPLTSTAVDRVKDIVSNDQISKIAIDQITGQSDSLSKNQISFEELEKISHFIYENNIQRAYIGVPSIDNEMPFQIAHHLNIPCTIAYEYMFKPAKHSFWNHVNNLASKGNCDFAVPLAAAAKDITDIHPHAKVYPIGHLSIDRSQAKQVTDIISIRDTLCVPLEDELIFISGTTQPTEVDTEFLNALLNEISTGNHPNIQLRMGLHPGVKDPDAYLQALLKACESYPQASNPFKIILTPQFKEKLQYPISSNPFILLKETPGANAALASDKVAQAVPGALLNEAALQGKPSYFHDQSAVPYLPKLWFANNLSAFFPAKPQPAHTREELDLHDTAPNLLTKILMR